MTPMECLRGQLEFLTKYARTHRRKGMRFACVEDLVLQHGTEFQRTAKRLPVLPIQRQCYQQAYRLATRKGSKWVYCEGYAVNSNSFGLHVLHAWVTRADQPGECYDLAWPKDVRDTAYIGIPFRPEFVRKTLLASRHQYGVLDTWWQHYPLITGKTRIEDVIWRAER